MSPDLLKTLVELGSFGVLVYVLVHLLTRVIPSIFKAFAEVQESFKDALDKSNADAAAQRRTFQEESERLRMAFTRQLDLANSRDRRRGHQVIQALLRSRTRKK